MQNLNEDPSDYRRHKWVKGENKRYKAELQRDGSPFFFYHYTGKDPVSWSDQSVRKQNYCTPVRTNNPALASDATGIPTTICQWRIELVINGVEELEDFGVKLGKTRWIADREPVYEYKLTEAIPLSRCIVTKMDSI